MNLEAIVVFVRVAEVLSFSAAARELGMPKSTVSKRIMELEELLGTQLIVRSTRHLALTEAGQRYFTKCSSVLGSLMEANQEIRDENVTPHGTIRVAAPILFGQLFLGRVVANYLREYPDVKVELTMTDDVDPVADGYDVTIMTEISRRQGALRRWRLFASSRQLFASPKYLDRYGTPTCIADLERHSLIAIVGGPLGNVWSLRNAEGHVTVAANARFKSNSFFLGLEALLDGSGICLLPTILANYHVSTGRLVPVLSDWEGPRADMVVRYSSSDQLPLRTRRFLEQMEKDMPSEFRSQRILSMAPRVSLESV